tara:strand:- start:119 stop:565 length:447 start_codon:yes stop_codon:yes gene_type:complete
MNNPNMSISQLMNTLAMKAADKLYPEDNARMAGIEEGRAAGMQEGMIAGAQGLLAELTPNNQPGADVNAEMQQYAMELIGMANSETNPERLMQIQNELMKFGYSPEQYMSKPEPEAPMMQQGQEMTPQGAAPAQNMNMAGLMNTLMQG